MDVTVEVERGFLSENDYHEWLSTTATIIQRCNHAQLNTVSAFMIAAKMQRLLAQYEAPVPGVGAVPTYQELVEDAAKIDLELAMCRAKYTIFMYDPRETMWFAPSVRMHGFPFDMNEMEAPLNLAVKSRASYPVGLVVSPSVVKFGDENGEGYEHSQWIVKRSVVCSEYYQ
jgi:hypothetical protein